VEIVFTALLVFVVLSTTTVGYPSGFGGLAAGLTLAMIHLATIPVDNTSVNPARSFGAAIYSGSDAMSQLWAFTVFRSGPLSARGSVWWCGCTTPASRTPCFAAAASDRRRPIPRPLPGAHSRQIPVDRDRRPMVEKDHLLEVE
jgi:hypothetical protein